MKKSHPSAQPDNAKTQRERFIEAAHELGVDESETAFKERLVKIARQEEKSDKNDAPKVGSKK